MNETSSTVEVDLWVWAIEAGDAELQRLSKFLSDDETVRASRFVFDRDRHRFIVARGRLRELLGGILSLAPDAVAFEYSAHGKPALARAQTLRFNLSHSEALAALAVTREHEIGIDIEYVRPLKEDVAARFFSERELAALKALSEHERLAAFYRCWTRKEAIVKAIGEGLSYALDSFDITLAPDEPAVVERFAGEIDAPRAWRLANFEPKDGYAGAIACRTGGAPLSVRRHN